MTGEGRYLLAHCLGTLRLAGTEKEVLSYLEQGDRERFANLVVLPPGQGPLLEALRGLPSEVVQAEPRAILGRARLFRRRRVDLVHVLASRRDLLAGRLAGARVVVKRNLPIRGYDSPYVRHPLFDRLLGRQAQATVTVAEALKRDLVEQGGADPRRIAVVPNGIEAALYRPPPEAVEAARRRLGLLPRGEGPRLVGTVARLHRQKGLTTLVAAVPAVLAAFPGTLFLVAGEGEEEAALREAARRLGPAGEALRFLGFQADVPALLACLDLFVLPSLWEGMPFAVLEAMAAGLPQVVSAVDGCRELVIEGETGLLVPPERPDLLAAAIARLLGDEPLRRRLGEAARRRAEAEFSPGRSARRLEEVFLAVLEGRPLSARS